MPSMSVPVHSQQDLGLVRDDVNKARSLVETALRLLDGGNIVDLSALDGRVTIICQALEGMSRTVARPLLPLLDQLVDDMSRMETILRQRLIPKE